MVETLPVLPIVGAVGEARPHRRWLGRQREQPGGAAPARKIRPIGAVTPLGGSAPRGAREVRRAGPDFGEIDYEGPRVRIRLPPAESLRTLGPLPEGEPPERTGLSRGTEGSNPSPSRRESTANFTAEDVTGQDNAMIAIADR
jgi:hypothetical protein